MVFSIFTWSLFWEGFQWVLNPRCYSWVLCSGWESADILVSSSLCGLSLWLFFKIFISVMHHGVVLFVSLALGFFELLGSLSLKFSSKFENFWTLFLQKKFFLIFLSPRDDSSYISFQLLVVVRVHGCCAHLLSQPSVLSVQRSRVVEFTNLSFGMSSC